MARNQDWLEGYDAGIADAAQTAEPGKSVSQECPIQDVDCDYYLGYRAGWNWLLQRNLDPAI